MIYSTTVTQSHCIIHHIFAASTKSQYNKSKGAIYINKSLSKNTKESLLYNIIYNYKNLTKYV